jgi:hypothetical protein
MELLIQNGSKVFIPVVIDGIEWTTERYGSPGKLTFKVLLDDALNITEGNAVRFKKDNNNIFYGFIFSKKMDKDRIITVTAYDQLRYLKNKATYVYENMTAGEVIKMIATDFGLQTGSLENTGYKIPSRVEDGKTLFDIIQGALDDTLTNQSYMYVMYDDFGKITLKGLDNMRLNLLIDESTGENFDYTSSIDDNTYNQVKLYFDNEKTGQRDVYIAKDSNTINQWGVLQYYESIQEGEDGKTKAEALLKLYNAKTRTLSIKNAIGDVRVRAGSMVVVMLDLGDVKVKSLMLVESCKHSFNENEHMMELKLRGGGDFVA